MDGISVMADVHDVRREVLILRHLQTVEGCSQIINTFEDENAVHIVMELCAAGDLFDKVQAEVPYTERAAAKMIAGILTSLAQMHQLGVIHRDIKPENFLVTDKGAIKFADFGLSSFCKPGQQFTDHLGSVNYMAPEVVGMPTGKGGAVRTNYDTKADVWSVGVILYILLSGMPPFWGSNAQIFNQIRVEKIDFETDPWPKISKGAKDCVMKMLERNVKVRKTAAEMLSDPWLSGNAPDVELNHIVISRVIKFSKKNQLLKSAVHVMASTLQSEDIYGLKNMFEAIDTDGSKLVSLEEFRKALEKDDFKIPASKLKEVVEAADLDGECSLDTSKACNFVTSTNPTDISPSDPYLIPGDHMIDWREFLTAMASKAQMSNEKRIQYAFKTFDVNNDGFLSRDEVCLAIGGLQVINGMNRSVDDVIAEMDLDNDGRISYPEFAKAIAESI
jgi:calcium-dependent protein kinase